MPALTRSTSATYSNKPYLTPQTPSPVHPRALIDMTPLPSLLDKIVEASKRPKRSTSLQLESKVDDTSALPSMSGKSEHPSSDPAEVHDIQKTSSAPTKVEDEPEPESVAYQQPATSDYMDCEDTPIVFSEPLNLAPPPAPTRPPLTPALVPPFFYGEAATSFFPSNQPHVYQHPESQVAQPPTNQEPFLLSELNRLATFSYPATPDDLPLTSVNPGPYFIPQDQAPFPPPRVHEQPQQVQAAEHHITYTQYPITSPILSSSTPVQSTMHPIILPVLSQLFPTSTTSSCPDSRQSSTFGNRSQPALAEIYHRPTFAPQVRQRSELDDFFARWFHHRTRVSSWRIREIERQREMDRIAEPYLIRLREVSLRKKAEAEARALAEKQKADRVSEERGRSWWDFWREDEKKALKELTEVERQQRSEERRQRRKDPREKGIRSESDENAPPKVLGQGAPVSSRRKSTGRSKPYSIPHPATRSPRRSHIMPGGFEPEDLTPGHQTGVVPNIWEGLRSVVDVGYRLWM